MSQLFARSHEPELLDFPGWSAGRLRRNFRDIKRVNRFFGGVALTLRYFAVLADSFPAGRPLRLLDVGTGAADLPGTWRTWCEVRGLASSIVALDLSSTITRLARSENGDWLSTIVGDGLCLPFPDGAFDIANCALMLHHLPEDAAVDLLAELDRVTTLGFVVNDLRRSVPGYVGGWLLANLTTRNPLTRNDAPLSVRRAFTVPEVEQLGRRSKVADLRYATEPWYRLSIVQQKSAGPVRQDA